MATPTDLLRTHLRGLREQLAASGIAVFVSAVLHPDAEPLLVHEGDASPALETANGELAAAFAGRQSPTGPQPTLMRGAAAGSWLVTFAGDWLLSSEGAAASGGRRRFDDLGGGANDCPTVVLSVVFAGQPDAAPPDLVGTQPARLSRRWAWAFASAAAMAVQVQRSKEATSDSLTALPGRDELFAVLERTLRRATSYERPFALLLVNPDDFMSVNDRFGREAGDRALREIAERLRAGCRGSDFLARYGSAIFGIVLPDTPAEAAREVAERTRGRLGERPLLDGAVRLSFSAGVAPCDLHVESPENAVEIVRRAHQALSGAKRAGGGTTATWDAGRDAEETRTLDRMSGIFTGSLSKDYRNISLLWDAVGAMAGAADFPALAAKLLEGLMAALRPRQVALVDRTDAGGYELVHGLVRRGGAGEAQRVEMGADLGPGEIGLIEACRRDGKAARASLPADARGAARQGCCVPMISVGRFIGALYLDGPADSFQPDTSDVMFLGGLASPLAVARDRALLFEQQRRRGEEERQRLEAELENLRRSLQEARLLHRSGAMDDLLSVARRVAPTDATILVTGESGTGKELLARTLHEMSPRRKGPFVVVDCGALPPTLMESELFGHERGAFTGAEGRRAGRLAEAEHGTVVLDEIGELPLELQSKLLRFVQERLVAPVGGRPRPVDARLIAATNRDLRDDVGAGRFRQDLFYRLNVVHLHLPPLRERPEDVLHLAEHYLERYALLYGRPARRLSSEAESEALRHPWPGNVRELQNRIMQAVILGEGEEIGPAELLGRSIAVPGAPRELPARRTGDSSSDRRVWNDLREKLTRSLEHAFGLGPAAAPPLGRWLEDDLVLAAHAAAGGVLRRAASLAGLPEATFRRRHEQATHAAARGRSLEGLGWEAVRELLAQLLEAAPAAGENRLEQLSQELFRLVDSHATADVRLRCALLGITPPTYRRRSADLARATPER